MSSFTRAEDWYRHVEGTDYAVTESFDWDVGFLGSGDTVTVEAGFVFNCSIPTGLQWLLDPHDPKFLKASALHDKLLKLGMDRPRAGAEFLAALKADGVGKFTRVIMWIAVTLYRFE